MTVPWRPLCPVDETHYRKVIRRLPEGTSSIAATFFEWPPPDTECFDDDHEEDRWMNVARYFRRRTPQPPQKSICFAATFLSQYLADTLGPTTNHSPFAFAFTGAIALLALGISSRPTSGLDVVFEGDIKGLITHLVQSPRFILPSTLAFYDTIYQFFIKVGPTQGDVTLAQDDTIYISINYGPTGARPFRNRYLEVITNHHDTELNVRSLNPLSLLRSKLRTYAAWERKRDWLDAYAIVESSAEWIDLDYLEPGAVVELFARPPAGLTDPDAWYNRYKARKAMFTARVSLLGVLWLPELETSSH